ncbi:CaiB/BaiF CoA transferase family protein [Streptomyces himalayensis]|uniref:CoA transferase n=1 Tax=Streptomyces himalayensis subsp. himalayensis TaxID=2756131 RepID=A0A7W0DS23_9ACTN|nr:CoA transferase [Streptomyces himalayensis]MBA2950230.1 CoA transferase [Streptomyces himalayensis subsp. himalayensis]
MSDGLHLLDGIRVVSLEQFIAAPYCTQMLADAGAEVIKVERPGTGDPRRWYDPKVGPDDDYISGGFASYNRGKKSVELDLSTEDDREIFDQLLGTADVLVSNLRPGSLARQGLAPSTLRERHPRLVICEISGFGTTGGPYAQWPAFDSVIQGMSGLSSLIGEPDGPPGLAPMGTMDLMSGIYGTIGILTALVGRATTGQGSHVDAAMYDIGAAFLERPLTLHEYTGEVPTRGIDRFSPVGAFRAGDGAWVSIVIPTDEMWRRCYAALGNPELESDPALDTTLKRAEHMADRIVPLLEEWAKDMDRHEAVAALRAAGQPAGVVQSIADVRACEHLAHRGLYAPIDDERARRSDGSALSLPRLPLLFDGRGARPGPVPRLGSNNDEFRPHHPAEVSS